MLRETHSMEKCQTHSMITGIMCLMSQRIILQKSSIHFPSLLSNLPRFCLSRLGKVLDISKPLLAAFWRIIYRWKWIFIEKKLKIFQLLWSQQQQKLSLKYRQSMRGFFPNYFEHGSCRKKLGFRCCNRPSKRTFWKQSFIAMQWKQRSLLKKELECFSLRLCAIIWRNAFFIP